jgi:hypothetical protein
MRHGARRRPGVGSSITVSQADRSTSVAPEILQSYPDLSDAERAIVGHLFVVGWPSLGLFAGEAGGFLGGHGTTEEAKAHTAAGLSICPVGWDAAQARPER